MLQNLMINLYYWFFHIIGCFHLIYLDLFVYFYIIVIIYATMLNDWLILSICPCYWVFSFLKIWLDELIQQLTNIIIDLSWFSCILFMLQSFMIDLYYRFFHAIGYSQDLIGWFDTIKVYRSQVELKWFKWCKITIKTIKANFGQLSISRKSKESKQVLMKYHRSKSRNEQ